MASNRDPRKKSRTRRELRTSSSGRSARSKASAKDTPRPTSSTDRARQQGKGSSKVTTGRGKTKAPAPRGAQGPATPPVQGPNRRVSGIIGTRKGSTSSPKKGPPLQKSKLGKPRNVAKPRNVVKPTKGGPLGKSNSSGLRTAFAAGMVTALATGSLRNPVSKAKRSELTKKSEGKYNTKDKDGTVRSRKKVGSKIVGPKKVGPKKVGTIAASFDKAFSAARKAGRSTFTFKGQSYSTKMK